jgi:UDP-N-acetylglucosamine transferase subunit ALG13
MLPFDRLIRAMDDWAAKHPDVTVFAQIGDGIFEPAHVDFVRMMSPAEFTAKLRQSELIVSHAGMGTVISALQEGRKIVVMPRRAAAREATTNHQVDAIRWLSGKLGVYAATDEAEIPKVVEQAFRADGRLVEQLTKGAPEPFVLRLKQFFHEPK